MNKIEQEIDKAKGILSDVGKWIQNSHSAHLADLPADAAEIGAGMAIWSFGGGSTLSTGIYQDTAGRLYTAYPGQYICASEAGADTYVQGEAARAHAAVARLQALATATITRVDMIEIAARESAQAGKMRVIHFGSSAAIGVDAAAGTVTFGWRSPAGHDDDPMSVSSGLLVPSEDHRYNERIVPLSDRASIDAQARRLNLSLVREDVTI